MDFRKLLSLLIALWTLHTAYAGLYQSSAAELTMHISSHVPDNTCRSTDVPCQVILFLRRAILAVCNNNSCLIVRRLDSDASTGYIRYMNRYRETGIKY